MSIYSNGTGVHYNLDENILADRLFIEELRERGYTKAEEAQPADDATVKEPKGKEADKAAGAEEKPKPKKKKKKVATDK